MPGRAAVLRNYDYDISGKVALVTGAASGLGLAIAEAMAENGTKVALLDINQEGLGVAQNKLQKIGAATRVAVADLSDRGAARRAIDSLAEHFGGLDIVFANAGVSGKPGFQGLDGARNLAGEIESISDADWDQVVSVNLDSVFVTVQRAAFHLKKRKAGRIIVTTSVAAFRNQGWVGTPYMPAKAGAAHLVRQAALELAAYKITVNAIAPGAFATNIGGGRMKLTEVASIMCKRIPLGRIALPNEIKGLALFLASPASGFITGAQIPIDGGASL
jgi:NAD(P)-dependent dehydrogenase (short-subunit alcohol dehydrogenase family)